MKSVSPALIDALKNGSAIKALPEVKIDWNLNRYHDTRVGNSPDETEAGYDVELFPVESIAEPLRPYKGINKARVGHSTISREYGDVADGGNARFYLADTEDIYKYWTSPLPAVGGTIPLFNTTNFPSGEYPDLTGHDGLTSARPFVEYGTWSETVDPNTGATTQKNFTPSTVAANKIVVRLENTWASPNNFDIVITRASSTQTITSASIAAGWEGPGEIVLYWTGTTWASGGSPSYSPITGLPLTDSISKVQLVVRTLKGGYQKTALGTPLEPTKYLDGATGVWKTTDGSDSFLDVIEISARLEADVSAWVREVGDNFDMSEVSHLYPIGTVTSNNGDITLSNTYTKANGEIGVGLFSRDNPDASIPWRNYIEANAEVRLAYAFYDDESSVTPSERVQQFIMYADLWSGQGDEDVSLTATDYSKFFNETLVPPMMWEDLKVPEIIWRVLDSVGFNDYDIDRGDLVTEHKIPVFFTDGESNVWEVLDEIAKATQTAIYFDGYGTLRVKTRDYAMGTNDAPVWTLQSEDTVDQKANIVTLDQTTEFDPNSIRVVYQKTNWSAFNRSQPTMQRVWEPEDETIVLRSTPLTRNLNADEQFIWLSPDDARIWPYEGLVQIQGEIIRYKGKQFAYYTGPNGGVRNVTTVTSEDEKNDIQRNKATPGYAHKSHLVGALRVARDEDGFLQRGLWNTRRRSHSASPEAYNVRHIVDGTRRTGVAGLRHLQRKSRVQLSTGKRFKKYSDLLLATAGSTPGVSRHHYGTRFRFVKESGRADQRGGIVIHNNSNTEDGYYIEFTLSRLIDVNKDKNRAEIIIYSRVDGKDRRIGRANVAIADNIYYELDVDYVNLGATDKLVIWVNGNKRWEGVIPETEVHAPGRFGMFARGKTKMEFEYLYAVDRAQELGEEDFSYLDKNESRNVGGRWDRDLVYLFRSPGKLKKKNSGKARMLLDTRFFDEFGPYVHEIREFDVKFEPTPVLHSRLYMTNDWHAICLEYSGNPFGAKFVIANTGRQNAVLRGEDSLLFAGAGDKVGQDITVLGRALVIDEAEEVVAENTDQIRARGKIESDLSSPWIQSKGMAQDIAAWIRDNFTYGNDTLEVEVFGNPLIEVSDVVHVDYPEKHINSDYYVTSVNNQFDAGIGTTLTLRRRV